MDDIFMDIEQKLIDSFYKRLASEVKYEKILSSEQTNKLSKNKLWSYLSLR